METSTGPNISSWARVADGCTSVSRVGGIIPAARRQGALRLPQFPALGHALFDQAADLLELRLVDQRADVDSLVQRIAHHQLRTCAA